MRAVSALALVLLALFIVPVAASLLLPDPRAGVPWREASREPSGLSHDPATTHDAVIQVFAAPAVSWRGRFAVHTWIAVKPAGVARYTRYEVVGFGVRGGAPAVRVDRMGPDNFWFGARPRIVLDRRGGADVDALIERVRNAVAGYPYPHDYSAWPGPNSNTFTAFVGRQVPQLGLALPANALGKDFLPGGAIFARAPSGTGYQLSLYGVTGILIAAREGIELNLLGLTLGFSIAPPGLVLPALGRIGFAR